MGDAALVVGLTLGPYVLQDGAYLCNTRMHLLVLTLAGETGKRMCNVSAPVVLSIEFGIAEVIGDYHHEDWRPIRYVYWHAHLVVSTSQC